MMEFKWPCIAICCYFICMYGISFSSDYLENKKEIAQISLCKNSTVSAK